MVGHLTRLSSYSYPWTVGVRPVREPIDPHFFAMFITVLSTHLQTHHTVFIWGYILYPSYHFSQFCLMYPLRTPQLSRDATRVCLCSFRVTIYVTGSQCCGCGWRCAASSSHPARAPTEREGSTNSRALSRAPDCRDELIQCLRPRDNSSPASLQTLEDGC